MPAPATSAPALRVGLVGYGAAGAVFHAPLVTATPGLELSAVVTRDPGRRAQAAADHPGVQLLDDADRLWAARPDLVVVATPNRTHVPLALAAVEAGLPVVVDKPFAASSADAERVVAAAERAGVLLTVFQNRRWDGDFLTVRRLVEQGRLGAVRRFESRFERWRPEVKPGWREGAAPEEAGGLLFDLGSHLVDQALQLLGPVEAVHAELDVRRAGTAVDDDAFVSLRHVGGARSHLWASSVAAHLAPRFRVLGEGAAYTVDGLDVQEAALRSGARPGDDGWGEAPPSAWGELGLPGEVERVRTERGAYEAFYAGVATALREGGPPPVDPRSAVDVLRVLEAAARSAGSGAVVAP